jgi:hypothetical protein
MCENETERIRRREEYLDSVIVDLAKRKPNIVFKTPTMIFFREVEDLISHILQANYKTFNVPAWRYYCREGEPNQNRLYYLIQASGFMSPSPESWIKLVAGDATDYSGHGSSDMELAEHFIKRLKLRLETRPLSYLLDDIKEELRKLTKRKRI